MAKPLGVSLLLAVTLVANAQAQEPAPPPPPPGVPAPPAPAPPNPPPPFGPRSVAQRIRDLRSKLESARPVNAAARSAIAKSRYFLSCAEEAQGRHDGFAADRYAGAADALLHIADHQQHLKDGPPAQIAPRREVSRHLQHVYFRLRQANFFSTQTADPEARSLPQTGREFYEQALQAFDHRNYFAADELAKCVDEVVRTLENLAQMAIPPPPPPKPGPPQASEP